jgi:hypothetical protein
MVLTVTKPTVGGSEDSWGTTINTALDDIVLEINSNADGTNTVTPNLGSGWEVGGVAVTSTAAELNILDGVTATAAELNTLDGDTAAISTTVVDADRVVFNDDGTMKQVAMSDLKTYINASVGSGSVTSVAMTVPTGLTVSGTPITTSGTLAVSLQSGYSIPTTSSQSNWNTAYGWGDHSSQGYLTSAPAPTTAQVGSATTGLLADSLGAYAFLKNTSGNPDGTASGSSMYYSNSTSNANVSGTNPSGTWRRMGYQADTNPTVFLKILT